MKTYIIICISLLIINLNTAIAQQQVIATAGGLSVSENAQINWTIGQVISGSYTGDSNDLVSGFHHGESLVSVVAGFSESGLQIQIFPNPTTDFLTIQHSSGPYKGSYQLISSAGQIIYNESAFRFNSKNTIEMGHLPEGIYVLIISMDNHPSEKYKIIKQ